MTKPSTPSNKTYNGSSQPSGISCPSGSTTGGTTSATIAGTYSQTCTPDGNHQWSDKTTTAASISWTIVPKAIGTTTITLSSTSFTYNGSSQKATVTVKDGSTTLTEGTHYTVSYPTDTTIAGTKTITITGKGNYGSSTTKTYSIGNKTVKTVFNPNGATLTSQSQSNPSSCSTTTSGAVECSCSIGNSSGCVVTSPAITAPSNSPTVVGFGTSAGSHSNSWSPKTQKTIYYNSGNSTYYAQTKHTASFTGTFTGTTEPGVSSISTPDKVGCSVTTTWNNATPVTTCNITSPTITPTTGNNVTGAPAGWYSKSGTRITGSGGSITLGSNQTFTARANITAAGVTYTDTYSIGCSTVQCAIDKLNTLIK